MKNFEFELLKSLVSDFGESDIYIAQANAAKVLKKDYTGVGVYIKYEIPDSLPISKRKGYSMEEYPKCYMEHPDLPAGAQAILWLKDGKISTLECYTLEGDWPNDESLFKIRT